MEYKILDAILEAHEAEEIAQDCRLSSEEEGAALWFNEVYYESTWHVGKMPKYNQFIKKIEGGNLYYDYGANYYFLVQENNINESKKMGRYYGNYPMKKKTIRLTESELKRMIVESAKNIISGLDWKTYANAAKKASINGDARTSTFRDAAITRFNNEYGYEDLKSDTGVKNLKAVPANYSDWESWRKNRKNTSPLDAETPHISLNFDYDDNNDFHFNKKGKAITDIENYPEKPIKTIYYNGGSASFPTEVFPSTNYESSKMNGRAYDEFDNYRKGNYEYTKGKGWHLPESIISKAINESFKSIIKEHDLMPGKNGGYFSTSDYIDSQKWTWRGVPNTQIIWHGENADYEVMYEDELLNGNELDDYAWSVYQDETDNKGNEQEFDNLPSEWFANILEDFSFGYYQ